MTSTTPPPQDQAAKSIAPKQGGERSVTDSDQDAAVEALRNGLLAMGATEHETAELVIHRADGRIQPDNPKGLTPREVQDFGTLLDGAAVGEVTRSIAAGAESFAALEPWALIREARPRNPVEATVLRSMSMAVAQQRALLRLSTRSERYAELSMRANREVCRCAETLRKLRQPASVNVGSGGQANVVGGDQHVHKTGGAD